MHLSMAVAFVGTLRAGQHARMKLRVQQVADRLGLTRDHPRRGGADIRAIEIQADATPQMIDAFFREAGIRATRACFDATRE